MDYTAKLKKVLSGKQLSRLQSLTAEIRLLMDTELFNHSLGTLNCCVRMADRFLLNCTGESSNGQKNGIDIISDTEKTGQKYFKLAVAAILHDYGKIFTYEDLRAAALLQKIKLSDFEVNCRPILHGLVAPFLLKRDFKITDREVLNSVRMHTTGSVKMNMMDKILYIADKIEETRDYEGVEKLRELSLKDINLCLLEVYKSNIIYVIKGNNVLHPDTARIWNYMQYGGLKNAT